MVYAAKLSELVSRLHAELLTSSTSPGFWTEDRKKFLINEAIRGLQLEIGLLYNDAHFLQRDQVTPNSGEIDLSTDLTKDMLTLRKIGRVAQDIVTGSGIDLVTSAEAWDNFNRTGRETWYRLGNILKTEQEITGDRVLLYHYRLPLLNDENDVCQFPEDYQDALVIRAAYRGFLQAKEKDSAAIYKGQLNEMVERMKSTAAQYATVLDQRTREVEDYGDTRYSNAQFFRFLTPPSV